MSDRNEDRPEGAQRPASSRNDLDMSGPKPCQAHTLSCSCEPEGPCTCGKRCTCQDAVTLLLDYLEGELPPDQATRLQLHLSHCPPCVEFVEGYQQTPKLCRKALEAKMPDALSRSLSSFLREKLTPGSS